jgi:molybdopterin converting factor small subunit
MFSLTVEMYGLPSDATSLREVSIDLNDGARISELVAALRKAIPALEGEVIQVGEDILAGGYTFNINGQFYAGFERLNLKPGDSVKLLLMATGG